MARPKTKKDKSQIKPSTRTLVNRKEKCTNCGVPVPKDRFKCDVCEDFFDHDPYYKFYSI